MGGIEVFYIREADFPVRCIVRRSGSYRSSGREGVDAERQKGSEGAKWGGTWAGNNVAGEGSQVGEGNKVVKRPVSPRGGLDEWQIRPLEFHIIALWLL